MKNSYVIRGLTVVFALGALVIIGRQFDLSKSDWAAWVQAVGSIAAIAGTFGVMWMQQRHQAASEGARQREAETSLLTAGILFGIEVHIACVALHGKMDRVKLVGIDDFTYTVDRLSSALADVTELPAWQLRSESIAQIASLKASCRAAISTLRATLETYRRTPRPAHGAPLMVLEMKLYDDKAAAARAKVMESMSLEAIGTNAAIGRLKEQFERVTGRPCSF